MNVLFEAMIVNKSPQGNRFLMLVTMKQNLKGKWDEQVQ